MSTAGQVAYLVLAEAEPDSVHNGCDRCDRDCYGLRPPQVSFVEQNMCDVMVARVDDEPLHLSDLPVGGVDMLAAANLDLPGGNAVVGDRTRPEVHPAHA
jgi:hypothetical protein